MAFSLNWSLFRTLKKDGVSNRKFRQNPKQSLRYQINTQIAVKKSGDQRDWPILQRVFRCCASFIDEACQFRRLQARKLIRFWWTHLKGQHLRFSFGFMGFTICRHPRKTFQSSIFFSRLEISIRPRFRKSWRAASIWINRNWATDLKTNILLEITQTV